MVVTAPTNLARVSVTDPATASAVIVSPTQVLIHGLTPGSITLLLWDEQNQTRSYEVQVQLDIQGLRQTIRQAFPNETITVEQSESTVILNGQVSSKVVVDQTVALAQSRTKNVVNLLTTPEENNMVLLQVRFAEVTKAAIQQLGLNLFSTGATNTIGQVSTRQFGGQPFPDLSVTAVNPAQGPGFTLSNVKLGDLLNLFIFRPDLNLGATIQALAQKNLLEVLAEPNILALNGVEATFLAGGEFPFPIVQGGTNFSSVTIMFKEFGVRLKFTPNILPDGRIRLKVSPEVSSLDFANGLRISGFDVPAITSRRADTQVLLLDGQSFAIAGLMDNRVTQLSTKVPGLGDLPIIGKLFQSRSQNKSNTELLVVVTPRVVKATPNATFPLPQFPVPFMGQAQPPAAASAPAQPAPPAQKKK
jgi:pilus assembly protein CpaC